MNPSIKPRGVIMPVIFSPGPAVRPVASHSLRRALLRRALFALFAFPLAAPAVWAEQTEVFGRLEAKSLPATSYKFSASGDLNGKDWQAVQKQTEKLATLKIGSFDGVSVNRWFGSKPIRIHYRMYVNRRESKGGIVISSGRTEGVSMYQELIHDLVRNGYSVYVHDHRGQGFSSRLLDDDKGYVDDFDNYVLDLDRFVELVRASRGTDKRPLYLLAHSMGGAIAARYLENDASHAFAAAALVTPMMQPWAAGGENPDHLEAAVQKYCDDPAWEPPFTIPWLSTRYVPGGKDFDELLRNDRFEGNGITSSKERYARNWAARKAACDGGAYCGSPSAKVASATVRWLNQACAASLRVRGDDAARIRIPVLLIQGGEDKIVNPQAQTEFCSNANRKAPAVCTGFVIPNAQHAVFIESDAIRQTALASVLDHFDRRATAVQSPK
ncbi:alpha/beta fold hydrolase [Variovorax sp. J22R133]|uniref:alpha/beta fold hydrolase n=1 Tax=Variovorax brevis TaxID=3053503 RepID=UPI002574B485|nr:alpha/beta fold hydrolase [Variovorax sp. J22R133]MDM0114735.1 alpha/beta fold hydrolase [Variovorax sp. J22R133]